MVFSSIRFIDAALTATGDKALSVVNDRHKWTIRRHLLSLVGDFPTLSPDSGTFIHDDGTAVHLLCAHGELPVPPSGAPAVLLTVWLHQSYPLERPMVYVLPKPALPILHHHPLVAPSGLVTSSYLEEWKYPESNLSGLVRHLVHLFRHNHPYALNWTPAPAPAASAAGTASSSSSMVSRREAMDRLTIRLCLDEMQFHAQAVEEIDRLTNMQDTLRTRAQMIDATLRDLQKEWRSLREASKNKEYDKDALELWLLVHSSKPRTLDDELEAFEAEDERSRIVLEEKAVDHAIDDVLYVLDEALRTGTINLAAYLKQVRALARDQFYHKVLAEEHAHYN